MVRWSSAYRIGCVIEFSGITSGPEAASRYYVATANAPIVWGTKGRQRGAAMPALVVCLGFN
jgi:hypothetical protein